MTLVVDASVAIRWLFPIDRHLRADQIPHSDKPLIAPDVVIAEITNAAWKFVMSEGLAPEIAAVVIREATKGFDAIVPSVELKDRALAIAIELRHPAYDCFYLALADQRHCQMVTADDRLIARCARTPFANLVRPLISAP